MQKGLVEVSIKQREQIIMYKLDSENRMKEVRRVKFEASLTEKEERLLPKELVKDLGYKL